MEKIFQVCGGAGEATIGIAGSRGAAAFVFFYFISQLRSAQGLKVRGAACAVARHGFCNGDDCSGLEGVGHCWGGAVERRTESEGK